MNVDHHVPRNTGAAPQMSCSTMPAQFGSSSSGGVWIPSSPGRREIPVYFCARGSKKLRFLSSVAIYIKESCATESTALRTRCVDLRFSELEVAPPHVDRRPVPSMSFLIQEINDLRGGTLDLAPISQFVLATRRAALPKSALAHRINV